MRSSMKQSTLEHGMKIELRGVKLFRDGVLVGAVWCFRGAWFSRVFAESLELGSRKYHLRENAIREAVERAEVLTVEEAAPQPSNKVIPKLDSPEAFED